MIDINGIIIKRQPEIIEAFKKSIKTAFGVDTDVSDEAVFGQIIGVFSEPISLIAEEFISALLSTNPVSADGIWFDYCAAFNGLKRLPALPSVVDVGCYGTTNSVIEKDKIFGKLTDGFRFSVDKTMVISPENFFKLYLKVLTVASGLVYSFNVFDGVRTIPISITANNFDTTETVVEKLLIDLDNVLSIGENLGTGVIAVKSKSFQPISIGAITTSTISFGIVCSCKCTVLGDVPVKVNSINTIVTPIPGLDSVINHTEGVRGKNPESTPEFKLRRDKTLETYGSSGLDAIVSSIKNDVLNVSVCSGKENTTDLWINDDPPHSIHFVVGGGDDLAIAQKIWDKKAGGIRTVGAVAVTVLDINGSGQQVRFDRPSTRYAWITIQVRIYAEEIYPVDGADRIKKSVLEYANQNYKIGLDLIPVRFIPAVLAIPGIEGVFIEVALTNTPNDIPLYTDSKLSIGNESFASFSHDRIFVTTII